MDNRKSKVGLRARVAARKAGVAVAVSPRRARILRQVKFWAHVFQGVGLVLLLLTLVQYIESEYQALNWVLGLVSAGLFLVGRVAIALLALGQSIR